LYQDPIPFWTLNGTVSQDFRPPVFLVAGSSFFRGRIRPHPGKIDRLWKNCGSTTLKKFVFVNFVFFSKMRYRISGLPEC
jgi:hypothetical protein